MLLSMEYGYSSFWEFATVIFLFYIISLGVSWFFSPKDPLVGAKSKLEAGVLSYFRFYRDAQAILLDGYSKVRNLNILRGL